MSADESVEQPLRTLWRPPRPVDLARTLRPLGRGRFDPCLHTDAQGAIWRATRTPEGPATTRFARTTEGIELQSWGAGAAWAITNGPTLLGADDDPTGFAPAGKLGDLHRRHPGLRIPRSQAVWESLLRSVCEQLVTGKEAARSHAAIVRRWGERAPGPLELWVPPAPETIVAQAEFEFYPLGLEAKRTGTLLRTARKGKRLDEWAKLPLQKAYARLQAIPGIGPWTAAEVGLTALGDADAVSVGDYHLKNVVTFAFTGEARGTDEQMLELLEPYRPHRARVIKLIEAAGISAPRFGPRRPLRPR